MSSRCSVERKRGCANRKAEGLVSPNTGCGFVKSDVLTKRPAVDGTFVPAPQFLCWSPSPQCDSTWGRGLAEVMRAR